MLVTEFYLLIFLFLFPSTIGFGEKTISVIKCTCIHVYEFELTNLTTPEHRSLGYQLSVAARCMVCVLLLGSCRYLTVLANT